MNPLKNKDCDLCQARKITRWYHSGDTFWAADCKTCGVPMIVLRHHRVRLTNQEFDMLYDILRDYFPNYSSYGLDFERRSIPDHFHVHLREKNE